ncbi:MAG: MATE family efflux transporter, partial [Calditrichaeota bacterium]
VGVIRGAGETFYSMIVNVGINTLNLILAPILIFGWLGFPRLEVFGAALAVGISHTMGFLITLYLLRSQKLSLFLSLHELTTPNWQTFNRLFRAGIPTTIEQLVWAVGQLIVTSYAAIIGITVLAAHQVFLRIQAILSMVYMGFGLGAMSLMGKNLGAEQRKLAQRTAELTGWIVFIFVLVIVALIIIFSRTLVTTFTDDPQVIRLGTAVIKVFALAQIPKAVDGVLMGNLRGAGDLKWLMWITIASVITFEVSINWFVVFMFNLSLWGLWMIHMTDETIRLVLNTWRFRGGKWKFIDL